MKNSSPLDYFLARSFVAFDSSRTD